MTGWIKNGVFSLAIAGLYSIVLVVLRTPQISQYFSDQSLFKSALVVHVNLSVLVWLMSVTCFIWSIRMQHSPYNFYYIIASFCSIMLISISPLFSSDAVMNNYIPMLENLLFVLGLSLFGSLLLCFSFQTILLAVFENKNSDSYGDRLISVVQTTSSFMFILVWVCFFLSYLELDAMAEIVPLDIDYYYEMLFWSGGHLLQYVYTQIFMLVLLILLEVLKNGKISYSNLYEMLLLLNFVLSLFAMLGHAYFEVSDGSFKEFFTLHMIYTAGIAPTFFILLLFVEAIEHVKNHTPVISVALLYSSLIFCFGGLVGIFISGTNVTIPAHYHGSIVGISIAFMGFVYLICFSSQIEKNIKYKKGVIGIIYSYLKLSPQTKTTEKYKNLSKNQMHLISFGQMLHIIGLAMAGGYGVMRKSPGQEIVLSAKIYMGMVGLGGLLAIAGGLIFVYICVRKLILVK